MITSEKGRRMHSSNVLFYKLVVEIHSLQYYYYFKLLLILVVSEVFKISSEIFWQVMVVHANNPSTLGGWGKRIAWTQEVEAKWTEIAPLHSILGAEWDSVSKKKLFSNVLTSYNRAKFHPGLGVRVHLYTPIIK